MRLSASPETKEKEKLVGGGSSDTPSSRDWAIAHERTLTTTTAERLLGNGKPETPSLDKGHQTPKVSSHGDELFNNIIFS